jgi:enamine deaminase RidA (YjgF/YER057c/UK114 family)
VLLCGIGLVPASVAQGGRPAHGQGHEAVANSMSVMVRKGSRWKTVVRMRSVLNSPITVSIRALSNASPTLPIEGWMAGV